MSALDAMTERGAENALPRRWTNFGGPRSQCDEVAAALAKDDRFEGVRFRVEKHRRGDRFGVLIAGPCDDYTEKKIQATCLMFAKDRELFFTEEDHACFVTETGSIRSTNCAAEHAGDGD